MGRRSDNLNRMAPPAFKAKLGDTVEDLIAQLNNLVTDVTAIRTKLIAALTKLDADAGVTDTNYASLHSPAAMTAVAVTPIESR